MAIDLLLIFGGFALVLALGCGLFQRRLIYFPRDYPANYAATLTSSRGQEIAFETSSASQTMFYIPARSAPGAAPPRLWVLFGGNAALALDWLDFADSVSASDSAFLLVDYPGYGNCAGAPSRDSILATLDAILPALAAHLRVPESALEADLNVLGHSLGAAVALEFAARHPVRRVVLLSPFTSMIDMARRQVGWPLMLLLRDRFDNRARLAELAERNPPPRVVVFHGVQDEIVPEAMGRELAALHPAMTSYRPVQSDHNWIIDVAGEQLRAIVGEQGS